MTMSTCDLYDEYGNDLQVAEPLLHALGGVALMCGEISTVKVHEDNAIVRSALESPGKGRALVVDGGGSLRCALVGDQMAQIGIDNGWAGIIVNGCVRDRMRLAGMSFGVWALAVVPSRSTRRGEGQRDVPVRFAGVCWRPGEWLCADADGIVVATKALA